MYEIYFVILRPKFKDNKCVYLLIQWKDFFSKNFRDKYFILYKKTNQFFYTLFNFRLKYSLELKKLNHFQILRISKKNL